MKTLLLLLFAISLGFSSQAQEEELASSVTDGLTPFTGTNFVRVVFPKKSMVSSSAQFKAVIRSVSDKKILWQGVVSPGTAINEGGESLSFTIKGLSPVLWTPSNPYLYEISLFQSVQGKVKKIQTERLGFRSFERRGGNLYLNGKPIFLRGIAINPPGRGIPSEVESSRAFALEYVRFMKYLHVNIIRIPDAEEWYDVCDELGMMVFGGNYSGKVASGSKVESQAKVGDETDGGFPSNYDAGVSWFENEKLGPIAHHPSLMVYALTNETPFAGERAKPWEEFLDYTYRKLKKWDDTRVYIANAGYGYGKTGDITDLHRYWGWYYSSPFTFLHVRNEEELTPYPAKHQPITFTECVGNYTGPDGRYNLTPAHKNPSSQLTWTGHAPQQVQSLLADKHQSFTFRQATETIRQMRERNPDLSGVFPFTILFYNWNTVAAFADMKPKPVTQQVRISYQPVLLSWECWTPNLNAGTSLKLRAHLINDDDQFRDLESPKLIYELRDKAHQAVFTDSLQLGSLSYFSSVTKDLTLAVPASLVSGDYQLVGRIISKGEVVSENYFHLFIADSTYGGLTAPTGELLVYDPQGSTLKALSQLKIPFTSIQNFDQLSQGKTVVIAENGADVKFKANANQLKNFMSTGGRILCLRQDSTHLENVNALLGNAVSNVNIDINDPTYPVPEGSPRNGYYLNPERPDHPVFRGLTRDQLRVWSDYTGYEESKPGWPALAPVTDGFTLRDPSDIFHTAILANFGYGLKSIAVAEQFQGNGSILLCGLDLVNRLRIDPVANRVFCNLLQYSSSSSDHDAYALITAPIIWGEYETEKGIVTDIYSGLLVNSTPRISKDYLGKGIMVTKEGYQLAGGTRSGFNTRPGIQYVANGRRPFGPYTESSGRSPVPGKTSEGMGQFWCRIPEGQDLVTTTVWNPSGETLTVRIQVNELPIVTRNIPAGEKLRVESSIDHPAVHMRFTGDRRLVLLETVFSKQFAKP